MEHHVTWFEIIELSLVLMLTALQSNAKEYTISGISAWSKAKENGLKFNPSRNIFDSYVNGKLHKSGFLVCICL